LDLLKTVEGLPCRDLGRWRPCAKETHFTVLRRPSTSAGEGAQAFLHRNTRRSQAGASGCGTFASP